MEINGGATNSVRYTLRVLDDNLHISITMNVNVSSEIQLSDLAVLCEGDARRLMRKLS